MLERLELENVGPAPKMALDLAPRLNLITGDNGLGKSFLLDTAWWALTRKWPRELNPHLMSGYAARPTDVGRPAKLRFSIKGKAGSKHYESQYSPLDEGWPGRPGRPLNPGLVIHAHANGGFSVWDPARNYWRKKGNIDIQDRTPGYVFSPEEVWNGLTVSVNGKTHKVSGGLIDEWSGWIRDNSENAERMAAILGQLTVRGKPVVTGPNVPLSIGIGGRQRDTPSIRTEYADAVPIVYASSALRRIAALAYMLLWARSKHILAASQLSDNPAQQIVLLFDEVDTHLHPRWQRAIVPAILRVMDGLITEGTSIQLIAATHSPLVLASVEPHFNEAKDRLFHLDIRDGQVCLDVVPWAKQGDVVNWLVSEVFGLRQGRSLEAEQAIAEAQAFMGSDGRSDPGHMSTRSRIQQELERVLPGHDPFWPRWVVWVERQAGQT